MTISADTKARLKYALNNETAGTEITDVLDVATVLSSTEAGYIDSVTAGTAANSKALVLSNTGVIATVPSFTATNANATTIIGTTVNATSSTATNANATTIIGTTVNATSGTITTLNSTTAGLTNATLGRMQITAAAVTAAGSAIGNAANLSYGMNIVASADNTTGVILPVAVANAVVDVISTVNGKSLLIYPQVNSAIAGLGANAALTLGPANTGAAVGSQLTSTRLVATNATQWYVMD